MDRVQDGAMIKVIGPLMALKGNHALIGCLRSGALEGVWNVIFGLICGAKGSVDACGQLGCGTHGLGMADRIIA